MRYSVKPRTEIYVKRYGFLQFASQKLLDRSNKNLQQMQ